VAEAFLSRTPTGSIFRCSDSSRSFTSSSARDTTNRLGNRPRAIKLLDLITVGLNGHADERAFAEDIRAHLEAHHGHPLLHQRPHDDPKFNSADPTTMPSLFI
jgi:hypothetical protein